MAMSHDKLARGKRSISINLKDPKGQEIVQKLTSEADILIEPFRPGIEGFLSIWNEMSFLK
jgi:alpha-methylacyl-CoA racemase